MTIGRACGKLILLGEHFVVHGTPAIAVGISNYCEVTLKEAKENGFVGPEGTSQELSKKSISNILTAMKINKKYLVSYGGNLPIFGGLGSSAAFSVAIVRALAKEHKIKLTNEQINTYSYEGEKAFHGNPSGLDNTMATYGGAILFTRGRTEKENKFEPLKLNCDLHLVVGITGIFGPTAAMVSKVAEYKKQNQNEFEILSKKAFEIVQKGKSLLEKGEINGIGSLMDENQVLLKKIGVSIKENEQIIHAMKDANALGAKITGGGGGGTCLALAEDNGHAKEILAAIKKQGFDGFVTEVKK